MSLELVKDFGNFGEQIFSVELSPDDQLLAVASCDAGKVCVYDTSSYKQNWSTNVNSFQAVFSPDGTQLGVADYSGRCVKIFASQTGALLRTLSGHTSHVYGVAWSSTGIIASASHDQTVRLWNPDDGTRLRTLYGHSSYVCGVSFSPDGTRLASCSNDNTIWVWDVAASGTCLHTPTGHTEAIWRVAFSPDGSKLASTSRDGTVRIWDSSSNFNLIQSLAGAGGGNWPTIAWTPDSRILASANANSLQLWDEDGKSILRVQNQASAVAISRFAHEIITGSEDGKVKRWRSPIAWSLLLDVKNGIPFGKLLLPSKSTHDVSRTIERVSAIIDRMDPPVAPHDQINRLHDIDNPIFIDMEKKTKIAGEIEQSFSDLIDQRQSLREAHESLQIKAHEHAPVNDVKRDLSSIDSSVRSIYEAIPVINKHLQDYADYVAIKPSSATPSLKQYGHPSPKELSETDLDVILAFARKSNVKLVELEQAVINTASKFEKVLLEYDSYAAEIREQSEKNLDALNAFLAHLTRPTIAPDRIHEIETTLSELQRKLDMENKIMIELDHSLSALSAARSRLNQALERGSDGKRTARADMKPNAKKRKAEGDGISNDTDSRHHSSSHPDVDSTEYFHLELEQAKAQLESTSGIAHNPHLVYKWLHEHPDAKLDAGEIFDIIGIQ